MSAYGARSPFCVPVTPVIVICCGVSGSGKSTLGARLAEALACEFLEGDDFHPDANIQKMARGVPLTDDDRRPWLSALRTGTKEALRRPDAPVVVACSCLGPQHRDALAIAETPTLWVFLQGSFEDIRDRLVARTGHFMSADMLASQFAALRPPEPGEIASRGAPGAEHRLLVVPVAAPVDAAVETVLRELNRMSDKT
ncbi:unnamed protein product [Pedinophyceae sp. YPF-701]|nr:unnamed protein product [Pedinophyceae sp. YPF-701]